MKKSTKELLDLVKKTKNEINNEKDIIKRLKLFYNNRERILYLIQNM